MKSIGLRAAVLVLAWTLCAGLALSGSAQKVSLSFEEAEYRHVFRTLGELAGLNVLIDPGVQGGGTFDLQDVTVAEALDLVAGLSGFSYRIKDSALLVADADRLKQFESTQIWYYQVQHVRPDTVPQALRLVMAEEDIYVQEDTGLVVLQGVPSVLHGALDILENIDRPRHVTIDSRGRSVLDVLEEITEELQLNLLADPQLEEKEVVFRARQESPWDVLEHLQTLIAIDVRLADDTVIVTLPAPPEAEEAREPDAPEIAEPERVKVYRIREADTAVTAEMMSLIVSADQIRADEDSQSVLVRATDSELAAIDEMLLDYDVALPQILLEVWVQEMTTDAARDLGVEWKGVPDFSNGVRAPTFLELAWQPWELVFALKALEDRGDAKLLANPKIATLSGQEASIFVGDRVPVVIDDAEGSRSIEFLESGIDLRVTPRLGDDGYITIQVRPEVSTFIYRSNTTYPDIRTREAETTVRVKEGQPVVIGGLLQEEEMERITKVPFISELPILGRLFQWQETTSQQTEMTIFLIPRLVDGSEGVASPAFFTETQ